MHGNDLCVADIPGILVFAVNHRRERVPLNAQIMIPTTMLQGPEATDAILRQLHLLTADLRTLTTLKMPASMMRPRPLRLGTSPARCC